MLRVISLGAGVQSTAMALMASAGEITPMPDHAIFADTGAEPAGVYKHLEWLMSPGVLAFPVHKVSAGNIVDDLKRGFTTAGSQGRFVGAPFFIKVMKRNQASFDASMGKRQCTRHYKIDAMALKWRELLGAVPRARIPPGSIEVWIGISMDEAIRMRPARHAWVVNRHPLIEQRITRQQCLDWLAARDFPRPAKSACTFCPFHDDARWRDMKANDPESWRQAVEVDELVRDGAHRAWKNQLFVHRSLTPLAEVDLSNAEDKGQLNLFLNECEGMCGT